ncbi:MAG: recombination protein RecR [Flavobacteriales bacterium]|nr:recombination protein RecR [Flavobacteriales bacterium]
MQIPSKYLENATEQIASLPGIGKKTALRLALNLLKRSEVEITDFTKAILELKTNLTNCTNCGNISDNPICSICENPSRDHSVVCVVEDIRDVMAIESTSTFKGIYHVLGGLISPMDGIGPADLNIEKLVQKAASNSLIEVIFALSPTMEGDTTNFYLFKKLQSYEILITTLSRGISVGSELQYADEVTLGRSIQHRHPFQLANK